MAKLTHKPKNDILFKMMFTLHTNLLRSLVASALEIAPESIRDLEVTNPEILPEQIGSKFCRLDINMVVDGQRVTIELQLKDEGNIKERAEFYAAKLRCLALGGGEDYAAAPKVALICITDFKVFSCAEWRSSFTVNEETRHERLTDKLKILFFEMKKIPKEIDTANQMLVWLKLLSAETEEDIKVLEKMEVDEVAQALNAYRQVASDPKYLELERMREKTRNDEISALANAERRGERRGEKRGEKREREKMAGIMAEKDAQMAEMSKRLAELEQKLGSR